MKKRGFVLILVLFLGLCLQAYAGGGQDGGGAEKVTFSFWSGVTDTEAFFQEVIADFQNENPNVEIEFQVLPIANFDQKLAVAVPSGSAANLLDILNWTAYRYAEDFFVTNPPEVEALVKKTIVPQYISDLVWDSGMIGLPFSFYNEILYWNKRMFAEAGLTAPPDTYDELIDYAKKLTKYDSDGNVNVSGLSLRLGGNPGGNAEKFWCLGLMPYGANTAVETSPGKFKNDFNNEGGKKALKLFIDLLYKYKVDDHKSMKDSEAFAKERTAMFEREQWVVGFMKKNGPNVDYDATALPKADRRATFVQFKNFYVTKQSSSAQQKAAWDFAQFVVRPENAARQMVITGWLSPRKDLDFKSILKDTPQLLAGTSFPPDMEIIWDPRTPEIPVAKSKLGEAVVQSYKKTELLDNPAGIAKEIEYLASIVDDVFKESGVYGK
jgi:multiple sugar transport system substrate-binding protein